MKRVFVVLLGVMFFCALYSQNDIRSFNHLNKKEGLPHSAVHCIYQDKLGFMWYGTEGGLCRYDGYDFITYKNNPEDSTSLCNNYVTSICEDQKGMLWIGTRNGLSCFSKVTGKFSTYKLDSIDGDYNWVTDIVLSENGDVWIGSKSGLYRESNDQEANQWPQNLRKYFKKYTTNGLEFIHYTTNDDSINGLNDNRIFSLTESKNGNLWIGTDNAGGENGALHLLKSGDHNAYPPQYEIYRHDPENPGSSVGRWIMSVYEDNNGWIWGGSWADGLFRINPNTKEVTSFRNDKQNIKSIGSNNVYQIDQDPDGNLWVCTYGGGLNIVTDNTIYSKDPEFIRNVPTVKNPKSIASDYLKSVYIDQSGVVWIGTLDNGINSCYYKNNFSHLRNIENDNQNLIDNNVLSIYEDKYGFVWFGSGSGTLSRYNPKTGNYEHFKSTVRTFNGATPKKILSITEFENKYLLLGTELGVLKFDMEQKRFSDFSKEYSDIGKFKGHQVNSILEVDENSYLFSSQFLLSKTNENKFKVSFPELPIFINHLFKDTKGDIWMASKWAGINHYSSSIERIKGYLDQSAAEFNVVNCIAETKSGEIYGGTEKGLVWVNAKEDKLVRYRESDGLANDFICGMITDNENNIWISTHNGLSKFDTEKLTFSNYYEEDGLLKNEFTERAFLKASDGSMYFGGTNGVIVFNPSNIETNNNLPNVAITAFKLYNSDVKVGEIIDDKIVLDSLITQKSNIELSYKSNVLSFEFAALDYQDSDRNKYAYMMEGVDNDWVYVSSERRFASYAGLQNGSYVFKVKASNNDRVWNEEPVAIKIEIVPPFWKRTWFRIMSLLLLISVTALIVRLKTQSLKNSKKKLEDKVRNATEEIKNRNEKLQQTQSQLTDIIDKVKNELGSASVNLLDATNSQASSIEEISASVEQMTENINNSALSASQMLQKAQIVEKDAQQSVDIVLKTVDSMKTIAKEIDFISEFARMTNLLSLNAAIEAARAGEHGKSFAVVANQVKKLAVQSQEVAVSIKKLSESGMKLSNEASTSILDLRDYIKNTVFSIAEISDSSQEQSHEASAVNIAVQEISKYVSETSLLSGKLDEAINSLSIDEVEE